jgi:putative MFS transporter
VSGPSTPTFRAALTAPVLVGALGYFVDIFDLLIFPVTSVPSLTELGVAPANIRLTAERILNWQMIGMLIGGVFWGVLGDKIGRRSVLFGSITLYSLANIANGFVGDVEMYHYIRLVAGFGFAGELGAAITLVSETLSKEARGYGTAIVASVGVSGAVFAGVIGTHVHWRTAYFIGGGLGFALLLLRVGFGESTMFTAHEGEQRRCRGNFFALLWPRERLGRYLCCILIGVPLWFGVGILINLSSDLAAELGVQGAVKPATAVAVCYAGLTLGDFASGGVSQVLGSRKKAVACSSP